MKRAAICGVSILLMSAPAPAQSDSEALRSCVLLSYDERMRCLEKLAAGTSPSSRDAAGTPVQTVSPDAAPAPAPPATTPDVDEPTASPPLLSSRWFISETRSPFDYSPVAIATASSTTGANVILQLSIECRSGRTEMVIRSAPMMRSIETYAVSYRINAGPTVAVTIGTSSSGSGIGLKGDVAGFLLTLPTEGAISFRVADRTGATLEGKYDLSEIKAMIDRMTAPCNWRRK